VRQGVEQDRVRDDEARLVECPDKILAVTRIEPVLPPTELSTWARRVVGIWMKPVPRLVMAAANPVRSPITPPPSAITVSERSTLRSSRASTRPSSALKLFVVSPGGRMMASGAIPLSRNRDSSASRW